MTTITFEENLELKGGNTTMSVSDFLITLEENGYFPLLKELPQSEITSEITSAYEASKVSKKRINI